MFRIWGLIVIKWVVRKYHVIYIHSDNNMVEVPRGVLAWQEEVNHLLDMTENLGKFRLLGCEYYDD